MPIVKKVSRNGLAHRFGIREGEEILSFNNRKFKDILDYIYAEGQPQIDIIVKNSDGIKRTVSIAKKSVYSTLGMDFDESIEIRPRNCANNCVFCFVDQLPKGMRDTLYIKDDDYRLSFISGSFITCTNLTESDIKRIIDYKLSPLYISVHSTNSQIRDNLLGKSNTDIMPILKRLTENGIKIHTQIVVVEGLNDKKILAKSLSDLATLNENILSVAVVPVGLTEFRPNKEISPFTKKGAIDTIKLVEKFYNSHNFFCFASDEMYEIADLPVKDYEYYGEFWQIENGVGLIAKLLYEVDLGLEATLKNDKSIKIAVITGVSGASVMGRVKLKLLSKFSNLLFDIYPIKNDFFGSSVTVSGLVTATDIISQMKETDLSVYDKVLIPAVMLKEFDTVFLDNISLEDLEKALNCKIIPVANDGEELVWQLTMDN